MIGIDVEQVANSHFRLRSVEQRHAEREGPLSGQARVWRGRSRSATSSVGRCCWAAAGCSAARPSRGAPDRRPPSFGPSAWSSGGWRGREAGPTLEDMTTSRQDQTPAPEAELSETETTEIEERLRGLGYID